MFVAVLALYAMSLGPHTLEQLDLEEVVLASFRASHDGFSSDEVILNEELNQRFLSQCRTRMPGAEEFRCNWKLMNMRKAGKLSSVKTTKRGPRPDKNLQHVAEFAARFTVDRFSVSIDEIMADPKKRNVFDRHVQRYDQAVDLYQVRKLAFQLRKARKLRPELITRIADWDRKITSRTVAAWRSDVLAIPEQPGVYLFHDQSGYLYIGQAENLQNRLKQQLEESSNAALLEYLRQGDSGEIWVELHSFPKGSRASQLMVRRAYESELIRSRKPKFNILP